MIESFYDVFKPTPEEQAMQRTRMQKVFNMAAKDEGCSTCEYCVVNTDLPYHPTFGMVEQNKCMQGLECDTVLFSVKHCPKYKKSEDEE